MPLADGIAPGDPTDPAWQPLSLAAKIHAQAARPQWFSSRDITAILLPILQALQTLSDVGLDHRDVKPENLRHQLTAWAWNETGTPVAGLRWTVSGAKEILNLSDGSCPGGNAIIDQPLQVTDERFGFGAG